MDSEYENELATVRSNTIDHVFFVVESIKGEIAAEGIDRDIDPRSWAVSFANRAHERAIRNGLTSAWGYYYQLASPEVRQQEAAEFASWCNEQALRHMVTKYPKRPGLRIVPEAGR